LAGPIDIAEKGALPEASPRRAGPTGAPRTLERRLKPKPITPALYSVIQQIQAEVDCKAALR